MFLNVWLGVLPNSNHSLLWIWSCSPVIPALGSRGRGWRLRHSKAISSTDRQSSRPACLYEFLIGKKKTKLKGKTKPHLLPPPHYSQTFFSIQFSLPLPELKHRFPAIWHGLRLLPYTISLVCPFAHLFCNELLSRELLLYVFPLQSAGKLNWYVPCALRRKITVSSCFPFVCFVAFLFLPQVACILTYSAHVGSHGCSSSLSNPLSESSSKVCLKGHFYCLRLLFHEGILSTYF